MDERNRTRRILPFLTVVAGAALLVGCGGSRTLTLDSLDAGTQTATYRGVMLGTVGDVYKEAHAYCSAYDKKAQMLEDGVPDGTITFACLE